MNKRLIANVIGCACLTLATAAEARTSYDGPWNLVFVTQRGSCDPTYNFSVNINDGVVTHPNLVKFSGSCRKIGRGSRVGDGPRQIRIRVGKADARRRPRDLERPRRRWALLGILDRATKQLGRNHPEASRAGRAERAVRGWAGDGPASRQDGAGQACRPYLSVTAAATNFLRPALPGLVPWAAHQSGNVAGSM